MSLRASSGIALTTLRAGGAVNIGSSLVNGMMPLPAGTVGFRTTFSVASSGSAKSAFFRIVEDFDDGELLALLGREQADAAG